MRAWSIAIAATLLLSSAESQWVITDFPPLKSPNCIAAGDGKLFVSTWGHGVYRSTDGGDAWEPINNGFAPGNVWFPWIVVAGSSSGRRAILYAVASGIWRSTDDGDSWEEVNSDIGPFRLGDTSDRHLGQTHWSDLLVRHLGRTHWSDTYAPKSDNSADNSVRLISLSISVTFSHFHQSHTGVKT
jgi:hypothetical protein